MKIVLIGYRCTGKSSIGKRLAQKLALPFYDTDTLIEEEAHITIKQIVNENGWDFFRKKETECIKTVASHGDCVIATGGGAVMDRNNAEILKKEGVIVWLMADVETILERMAADTAKKEQRPPLSGAGIRRETENMLRQRIPVYGQLADLSIDTVQYSIDQAVEEICRLLRQGNL